MGLVKSYSNYVLQKKHQLLNNGTVYERDFSTVGGVGDTFNSNNTYSQGTFVYTINNEIITPKVYNNEEWVKNGDGYVWTKNNIINTNSTSNSLKIFLKQDLYKLKDFAYYGSCVELIKNSINDIIKQFPGELYVPYAMDNGIKKGYEVVYGDDNLKLGEVDTEKINNEKEFLYLIDNPFNLNVHTKLESLTNEEQQNIKFITKNFHNYTLYDDTEQEFNIVEVTVKTYDEKCFPYLFATTTIKYEKKNNDREDFIIQCFYNDKGQICYLTNDKNLGLHIRPNAQIREEFFANLDSFQSLLLNKDSYPIYSNIFEVMEETENGYKFFYEKFTFPLTDGKYNLDIQSGKYGIYLDKLLKYAYIFDDVYCDNLYRQMTHESIKNFDWSDVLNRGEETKEEYDETGERIQKILHIYGRELDEIKFYIDGIKNSNNISYNNANNLPDYFLTDVLNIEGWDVKNIFPFKISSNKFEEDLELTYQPYAALFNECGQLITYPNGYASGYWNGDCAQSRKLIESQKIVDSKGYLRNRIKQYVNNKTYTMKDLNDNFMKHLKLNSKSILSKKGTIEGIETLLSLFGLKSKRWFESLEKRSQERILSNSASGNCPYDYEIKEYVAITKPIEEITNTKQINSDLPVAKNLIDFFNSTKKISYNTYEYANNIYVPYQGLPIRYYEINDKRFLFPYFSKNQPIDGKPYYQMNGGWGHKEYYYSGSTVYEGNGMYEDTYTTISTVNTVKDLLQIDFDELYNGNIYYVNNIMGEYVCVNDKLYAISHMTIYDNDTSKDIRYFEVKTENQQLTIGQQTWVGEIKMYDESGFVTTINLDTLINDKIIKIFINDDNSIYLSNNDDQVLICYTLFKDGKILLRDNLLEEKENEVEGTNYFILYDKNWHNTLGLFGWNQLTTNSVEYNIIRNIKRNYNANNPHTNALKYDMGVEYVKHFSHLFKYSISNNLFNSSCYSSNNEYISSLYYMDDEVGFSNLIELTDCYDKIKLYEDKKIHHFCDIINNNNLIKYFYELDEYDTMYPYNFYNFYQKKEYSYLKNDENVKFAYDNDATCLDQIINLKNIDIIFTKISNDNEEISKQRKYFDEVISHYLLQIIPSNVILNIKFDGEATIH